MTTKNSIWKCVLLALIYTMVGCDSSKLQITVFQTSADGDKLTIVTDFEHHDNSVEIQIDPTKKYQTITGFGGSFTESTAYLLHQLSPENRRLILNAYFADSGAKYSLTRTHMNSCDFSLGQYSYAPVEGDTALEAFTIEHDLKYLIPTIKEAQEISKSGFRIISSPWTAPPWMKDNNSWVGGKLLPRYKDSWALFFSKYIDAYKDQGIDIWGFTVENEPLGNGNNWESMHFSAQEMTDFVQFHLGPTLKNNNHNAKILGYDQNRDELEEWVKVMYKESPNYFDGTAVHWYASTFDYFSEALQAAHEAAPNKHLIQTEACVDSEVPKWKDDAWYWSKEATDWGWDWASEETKYLHPKYSPVNRYARDIIGCLNNWVDGWVDWNMVLDKQGGPNWFENWCVAPVIVDPDSDEVYFTPIYYTLAHFSKYIRPDAQVIGLKLSDESLLATAARNEDGTIAIVIFNQEKEAKNINIDLDNKVANLSIDGQAIQTVIIK